MGITRSYETAYATGLATTFVLSFASVCAHIVYHSVLLPLELEYLKIIVFIVIIVGVVQLIDYTIRASSPLLHQLLGIYLPLITSNCAVLGVALIATNQRFDLLETLAFSIGAACGFTLVMVLFGALKEQVTQENVPTPFRGTPITLMRRYHGPRIYGISRDSQLTAILAPSLLLCSLLVILAVKSLAKACIPRSE